MKILLIGDVHGHIGRYIQKAKPVPYSLQVGDLDFNYDRLSELDPNYHKVVAGNHDNYERMTPHFLGDFGVWNNIFFVRGEYSIDKQWRTPFLDWWPNEELGFAECCACIDYYKRVRPEIVVTHGCPASLIPDLLRPEERVFPPSRTTSLLEKLYKIHQPQVWVFGHWHRSWTRTYEKTTFTCLNELETLEIDL